MKKELNNEQKLAIRDYMRTMIAVPGIFVAVIMFFVGFFIKDVAVKDAYFKANEIVTKQIREFYEQSSDLKSKVKSAIDESNRLLKESEILKKKLEDATDLYKKSKTVEEKVAATLANSPDFKREVARKYGNEINESLKRFKSRIDHLVSISNDLVARTKFIKVIRNKTVIDAGPNELVIQDDGNVVVYKKMEGRQFSPTDYLWKTDTDKKKK